MNDLNAVILEGNLTREPEVRQFADNTFACKFTIAVNRYIKKKNSDESKKSTAFFMIEAWGPTARMCSDELVKGRGVRVVGKLRQTTWLDDREPRERIYILAEHIEIKTKFKKNPETGATEETVETKESEEISIKIPAGVSEGQYLNLRGEGNCGPRGGACGDLLAVIAEKPDEFFTREGDDLHCEIKVPVHKLVLGGTQRIPTLDGDDVQIKIAAGTQAGSVLRLREQGLWPLKKQGDRGSLYVEIGVEIPKDLSREEKELYQKLAEIRKDKETAQEESFLQKMKNLFK